MTHKLTNLLTHYRSRNPNPSQQQTDLETVLKFLVNYIIQLEQEVQQLKVADPGTQKAELAFLKQEVLNLSQQLAQSSSTGSFVYPQQTLPTVEEMPRNIAKPKTAEELINDIPNLDSGFGVSETDLQSYLKRPRVSAADVTLTEQEKAALQPKKPVPSPEYNISPLVFKILYIASVIVFVMVCFVLAIAMN